MIFKIFMVSSASTPKQKGIIHWRCRGLNPGPFTCKANALPLRYIPCLIIVKIFADVLLPCISTVLNLLLFTSYYTGNEWTLTKKLIFKYLISPENRVLYYDQFRRQKYIHLRNWRVSYTIYYSIIHTFWDRKKPLTHVDLYRILWYIYTNMFQIQSYMTWCWLHHMNHTKNT